MPTLLVTALLTLAQAPADTSHLWRAEMLRAAPGRLAEVLSVLERQRTTAAARGEGRGFLMRHRQGDHWDLMLLTPMRSAAAWRPSTSVDLDGLIAWREDLFLLGPPPPVVEPALTAGALHHLEMFLAVPGRHSELVRERQMENAYLAHLERPQNLIFVRAGGAAWDVVTIGTYRDMAHFGESDTIPAAREEAAARAAGFDGAGQIGFYLRTLITRHQDTLARAVP